MKNISWDIGDGSQNMYNIYMEVSFSVSCIPIFLGWPSQKAINRCCDTQGFKEMWPPLRLPMFELQRRQQKDSVLICVWCVLKYPKMVKTSGTD